MYVFHENHSTLKHLLFNWARQKLYLKHVLLKSSCIMKPSQLGSKVILWYRDKQNCYCRITHSISLYPGAVNISRDCQSNLVLLGGYPLPSWPPKNVISPNFVFIVLKMKK